MDYDLVVASILEWAETDPNIRAIVLTGSAATGSHHRLSDRDLEIHLHDTQPLEDDDSWWNSLGDVLAVERLEDAAGRPTRLIYYVGGKLDFTLVGVDNQLVSHDRPFQVLLDKDGSAARFHVQETPPGPPGQEDFDECLNWACAAALMTAKAIARDEPWSIMIRDSGLKSGLLQLIEWDHTLRYGPSRDVRHLGTRMRNWMDQDIQDQLERCWQPFAGDGSALLASMNLFGQLASRVAGMAGLADFDHQSVRAEVERILADVPG